MTDATILLYPGPRVHVTPLPDVAPVFSRARKRRTICGVSPISFTIRMGTCLGCGIALAFIALALSIPPA